MRILCHRQKGGAAVEQSAPLGLVAPGDLPRGCTLPGFCIIWHPGGAYFARREELQACPGLPEKVRQALEDKDLSQADQILAQCEALGIWVLTCQDAAYPQRLGQLDSAPCVLYGRGRLPQMDQEAAVALVGAAASPYGIMAAGRLGLDLARQGPWWSAAWPRGWTPPPSGGARRAAAGWCRCWAAALTCYPRRTWGPLRTWRRPGRCSASIPGHPARRPPIFLCATASSPA